MTNQDENLQGALVNATEKIRQVKNQCELSAYALAGDASKQDEMKMLAVWAATLYQVIEDIQAIREAVPTLKESKHSDPFKRTIANVAAIKIWEKEAAELLNTITGEKDNGY